MRSIIFLLCSILCVAGNGQYILTEASFLEQVRRNHPVARAASLNIQLAKAERLSAAGAFDPQLIYSNSGKNFEGVDYYRQSETVLSIPTWFGIDLYGGREKINGSRVNPEESTGTVSYAGINIPVLQNLLMDKRRAAVKQAAIMINSSETERRAILNHLLRDAQETYWEWWQYHQQLQVVDSTLSNANKRLQLVRTAVRLGERAAIDTVEALTQVQSLATARIDVNIKLLKAKYSINAFIWNNDQQPGELLEGTSPAADQTEELLETAGLLQLINEHPELKLYQYKLSALQVEKQLAFQSLLPKLDLKYNQLRKTNDPLSPWTGDWLRNNYRYGVSFALPLRLSKGRSEYRKAKLKIEQAKIEQLNKKVQLETKVRQYFTEWEQSAIAVNLQQQLVNSYTQLERGEEIRFVNGESSLFLVNAREQKTLEAREKLISAVAKRKIAFADLRWSAALKID